MSSWEITIKNVPALKVASIWANGLPFNETVPKAFGELGKWMESKSLPMPKGSLMGLAIYYGDPKVANPAEVKFKVSIPVSVDAMVESDGKMAVEILPEYRVAFLTYRGPYTNLEEAYNSLFGWVFSKGHQPIDAPREVYLNWGVRPEDMITEIQVPIGR
ncbi:MAG: GyrI-like domain-containing protein [Methanotrichaceae archaeon]